MTVLEQRQMAKDALFRSSDIAIAARMNYIGKTTIKGVLSGSELVDTLIDISDVLHKKVIQAIQDEYRSELLPEQELNFD